MTFPLVRLVPLVPISPSLPMMIAGNFLRPLLRAALCCCALSLATTLRAQDGEDWQPVVVADDPQEQVQPEAETPTAEEVTFTSYFEQLRQEGPDPLGFIDGSSPRDRDPGEGRGSRFQLNRLLPIGGDILLSRGFNLSLPYGAGGTVFYSDQPFNVYNSRIAVNGLPEISAPLIGATNIRNTTFVSAVRGDVWVLPVLNLYFMAGEATGLTTGNQVIGGLPGLPPLISVPIRNSYQAPILGAGFTAVGAYEKFFASFDYNSTTTRVPGPDAAISAQTYTPRAGLYGKNGAVWVGGCYQFIQNTFRTEVISAGVPVSVLTDYTGAEPWNFVYGVRWSRFKNVEMSFEHGIGPRQQAAGMLAVRF